MSDILDHQNVSQWPSTHHNNHECCKSCLFSWWSWWLYVFFESRSFLSRECIFVHKIYKGCRCNS